MNHCQEKSGPTEEKAESTSILKVDSWKMTHKSGDVERSFNSHGIKSKEKNHEMPVSVNQDSNGKRNRRRKDSESPVRPCPIRPESLKEAKKFKWEKPSFIIKITQRSQTRAPCVSHHHVMPLSLLVGIFLLELVNYKPEMFVLSSSIEKIHVDIRGQQRRGKAIV
ncbi:uncharacterized protein DS421_11g349190 [Arachis hypogaea]|nr:uncharacterized protein DS421_11g349190 [Arachis hypogaea]